MQQAVVCHGLPPLRRASVVEYWNTPCARCRSCLSYLRGHSDGGTKRTFGDVPRLSAFVAKLDCSWRSGSAVNFGRALVQLSRESTALTHRYRNLTPRLREANGGHRWRRTAEKLSKPHQVLCGCGEQHFILGAAQATQPKPVEL